MDGVDCYVVQIRPRQMLQGQRLFDGILWVSKQDYSIVRIRYSDYKKFGADSKITFKN